MVPVTVFPVPSLGILPSLFSESAAGLSCPVQKSRQDLIAALTDVSTGVWFPECCSTPPGWVLPSGLYHFWFIKKEGHVVTLTRS